MVPNRLSIPRPRKTFDTVGLQPRQARCELNPSSKNRVHGPCLVPPQPGVFSTAAASRPRGEGDFPPLSLSIPNGSRIRGGRFLAVILYVTFERDGSIITWRHFRILTPLQIVSKIFFLFFSLRSFKRLGKFYNRIFNLPREQWD